MRALFALAIVAATAIGSSAAFFSDAYAATDADKIVASTVRSYDSATRKLRLTNGKAFIVPSDYRGPALTPGEKVVVNWSTTAGKDSASRISVMP